MLTFICYSKCSTCRKAKALLDSYGAEYKIRDIKADKPSFKELKAWHSLSALPVKKFFNTSGTLYKSLNLKDKLKDMNEDECFELLATDGMLVKRPLLVDKYRALVGFNADEWESVFTEYDRKKLDEVAKDYMAEMLEKVRDFEVDPNALSIQEMTAKDYPLLEDFLYHAIYIPPGEEVPDRKIIFTPEIYVYIKDFGNESDCGAVARKDGKTIGMAWTRIIPAYGNIDKHTPELAISILPEYRGQNIGSMLMLHLFDLLSERGYKRTSLSVQKNNPAVRFYERLGYKVTDEKIDHAGHEDYIMVKRL